MRTIGILMFDGVEELDAVGPWDVLSNWALSHPDDGYRVVTFSDTGGAVRCAKGLSVAVDHSSGDVGDLAVLVYPGGQGTRANLAEESHLDWLRDQRRRVPLIASVCTGALVLAAAGLLAGRPATTHWEFGGLLTELDPTVELRSDVRFVDDGDLITAAGVSAGIDMALHLVDRLAGRERAREVRRAIQYEPAPAD